MNRLIILGISCSCLLEGCAAEAGAGDDGAISSAQAQQDVISGPTIWKAGTSSAQILASSTAGPGLEINGGLELGSYVMASYSTTSSGGATAGFTVTPGSGAAFVYFLQGTGTRYQQLRLQRAPGSSALQATASTGNVTCGTLASGTSTDLTVVLHAASATFDVLIGGAASECTSLPTRVQPPIVGFGVMDASNEGWGGRTDFTGLTVF